MARLSEKYYQEFKEICDKQGIKYESDFEMRQSADNLIRFFEVLIEIEQKEQERKRRLVDEPKGFSMPGEGRSCQLCWRSVHEEDGWYDKWGFKCMACQRAVEKRLIPGSLCGDHKHEKCITDSSLSYKSGLHVQTIRKLIRQGKIKARSIPSGPFMILRKDNPNIINVLEEEKKAQVANVRPVNTNSKV